jgi:hypothetical protein
MAKITRDGSGYGQATTTGICPSSMSIMKFAIHMYRYGYNKIFMGKFFMGMDMQFS